MFSELETLDTETGGAFYHQKPLVPYNRTCYKKQARLVCTAMTLLQSCAQLIVQAIGYVLDFAKVRLRLWFFVVFLWRIVSELVYTPHHKQY